LARTRTLKKTLELKFKRKRFMGWLKKKDCGTKEGTWDLSSTDPYKTETMLCVGEKWIMNWKGYGREQLWPNGRYYLGICLEGLSKIIKTVRIASPWCGSSKI
jgi:hypothetical protein